MKIQIHYRDDQTRSLYEADGGIRTHGSAGFDLILAKDAVFEKRFDFQIVDLGIIVKPPAGCHSLVLPRSSTFKRWQLLQANSIGLIDADYCGEGDYWGVPLLYLGEEPLRIPKGIRLAQFLLMQTLPVTAVEPLLVNQSGRGGFGSTGA